MTWLSRVLCRASGRKWRAGAAMLTGLVGVNAAMAATPPPAPNATQIVTTLDDHDDGACTVRDCTLREAINAANANADQDYIEFAGDLEGYLDLQDELPAITTNLEINNFTGKSIILNGTPRTRILVVSGGSVKIANLIFTGGSNESGGGAILAYSSASLKLVYCEIAHNFSGSGGGIFSSGRLLLEGCSLWGNGVYDDGGAIVNFGTAVLNNCTVSSNDAGFSDFGNGGGIANYGSLTLKSTTVTLNDTAFAGGGVWNVGTLSTANSIFSGNTAAYSNDVDGGVSSSGYNFVGDGDGSAGFNAKGDQVGTNSIPLDAKLESLDYYGGYTPSHKPKSDSPVVDQGNRFGLVTDQRGRTRPVNLPLVANAEGSDGSDIGSFELQANEVPYDVPQDGTVLTVNTTNDNDDGTCSILHCSLREAINAANKISGANTIGFNIPGNGVRTIKPTKLLPDILGPTTIDGSTQYPYNGKPLIELQGGGNDTFFGLFIKAANCVVKGLAINSFSYSGVYIYSPAGRDAIVQGCYIGTDASGQNAGGPQSYGVVIEGAKNALIGGNTPAQRNVISGNSTNGVLVVNFVPVPPPPPPFAKGQNKAKKAVKAVGTFNDSAVITGNYIGTDWTGLQAVGNGDSGVSVFDSSGNRIGGATSAERNLISGNNVGVRVAALGGDNSKDNLVQGNFIGTDKTGKAPLGNAVAGVVLQGSSNTLVGGAERKRNLICGSYYGISIINYTLNGVAGPVSHGNRLENNSIGVGLNDTKLGNFYGVYLTDSKDNVIGGSERNAGNIISGNAQAGIQIGTENLSLNTSRNSILGNYIGINEGNSQVISNGYGVILNAYSTDTKIGGNGRYEGNIITGNNNDGLLMYVSYGNTVYGNYIGTDASGEIGVGNAENGIHLIYSFYNTIGGTGFNEYNVVSANGERGIFLESFSGGNLIQNNIVGADAGAEFGLGNAFSGIRLDSSDGNSIGTGTEDGGNLIVDNGNYGVFLQNGSDGNVVFGNDIEANTWDGISVEDSSNSLIYNNGIFDNGDGGVFINGANAVRNTLSQNEIAGNRLIGIDLKGPSDKSATNYVTPNDLRDADSGPNHLQNYPVITQVATGSSAQIKGTLNSVPNQEFRIELFSDGTPQTGTQAALPQAEEYLGAVEVTTDASGNASFTFNSPGSLSGHSVVATATNRSTGDTSEFSRPRAATISQAKPSVSITRTSGLNLSGSAHIEGIAKDSRGIVKVTVRFERKQSLHGIVVQTFERTATLGTARADGSVVWTLDTTNLPSGFYTVQAIATNALGNTAESNSSNLYVLNLGR